MKISFAKGTLLAAGTLTGFVLVGCSGGSAKIADPELSPATEYDYIISADYPEYGSAEELLANSDLVVKARVIDSRVVETYTKPSTSTDPRINPQLGVPAEEIAKMPPSIDTVFGLQVDEVLSGSTDVTPGERIEVSQMGGVVRGISYGAPGLDPLSVGTDEYVLVLKDLGSDEPFALPDPSISTFIEEDNGSLAGNINSAELGIDSVSELTALADTEIP